MTYGLELTGADGIYQLNSNTSSTYYLGVHVNTSTSTLNTDVTGFGAGDFVFAKPKSNNSSYSNMSIWSAGSVLKFGAHADYLILKISTSLSDSGGSNYGLSVINNGNTEIFNTKKLTKGGIEILLVKDENSLDGGGGDNGPPASGNVIYQAPSGGNLNNVWFGTGAGASLYGSGYTINSCYYDYATNPPRILYQSWVDLTGVPGGGMSHAPLANGGKILIGALHE